MNITEIEKNKKERLQYMLLGDPVKKFRDWILNHALRFIP